MNTRKNIIIAVAVLAIFVVGISLAKLSIDSQSTPTLAEEQTVSEDASLSLEFVSLYDNAIETAAFIDKDQYKQMETNTRYFINYSQINDYVTVLFAHGNNNYAAPAMVYPMYDSQSELEFWSYSLNVFDPPGMYYSEDLTPGALNAQTRWLLTHSVPYYTLTEAQGYFNGTGYADAGRLTEYDIFYATQMAIWNVNNSVTQYYWDTSTLTLPDWIDQSTLVTVKYPLVQSLYAHILSTLQMEQNAIANVELSVLPASNLTLKKNKLGPFDLTATNILPQDANTQYNITLLSDKEGLKAQILDKDGNTVTSVGPNQQFYIKITNYDELPAETTYNIMIKASSVSPVTINREGYLTTNDILVDAGGATIAGAPMGYAFIKQDTLRANFEFTFKTSKTGK